MTRPGLCPRRIALLAFCAFSVAALSALGVWQVERRTWKLNLISRVNHRVHAAPVDAPGPKDWAQITAKNDEYRRVRVSGTFLNNKETLVEAVTAQGPGFWVMTPLHTAAGANYLINRGFVPRDHRTPQSRKAGQLEGKVTVTGLIRMTEPKGAFLRTNNPAAGFWYSRDVKEIAAARGLMKVAPYFIDADAAPNPGGLPIGGLTIIAFHNNHLVYALTWFTLAMMAFVGLIYTYRQK